MASAIYYGEPTPPGVAASAATFGVLSSTSTKMCIDAVLAGAIIGKAGANVKQISRLTGMHPSHYGFTQIIVLTLAREVHIIQSHTVCK